MELFSLISLYDDTIGIDMSPIKDNFLNSAFKLVHVFFKVEPIIFILVDLVNITIITNDS